MEFAVPIQMQLSFKPKTFSFCLIHFWNLHQVLNILKKKMVVIATLFWKLKTVKDLFRFLSKNNRFRIPFDSQDVKGSQSLVKSA